MIFATKARPVRRPLPKLDDMPNLNRIVAGINWRRRLMARPEVNLAALTLQNAESIRLHIDTELSPEFLHEDGEISPAQARVKQRSLRAALAELDDLLARRLAV